jgi:hypothetical protein
MRKEVLACLVRRVRTVQYLLADDVTSTMIQTVPRKKFCATSVRSPPLDDDRLTDSLTQAHIALSSGTAAMPRGSRRIFSNVYGTDSICRNLTPIMEGICIILSGGQSCGQIQSSYAANLSRMGHFYAGTYQGRTNDSSSIIMMLFCPSEYSAADHGPPPS